MVNKSGQVISVQIDYVITFFFFELTFGPILIKRVGLLLHDKLEITCSMDPMGKIIVDHEFGNQRALDRVMGGVPIELKLGSWWSKR